MLTAGVTVVVDARDPAAVGVDRVTGSPFHQRTFTVVKTSEALAAYIEALTLTQGGRAGHRLQLMPWQRDTLALFDTPGNFAVTMGRGCAKTTTLAAAVDGPLAAERADVVLVSASMKQSRIAFEHAGAFLWGRGKPDRKRFRVHDSTNIASIQSYETGARMAVHSAKPETLAGLAPSIVLLDEPASYPANTRDRTLAILRTGLGKIPGGRLVAVGTRAADPSHWFERMLQEPRSIRYAVDDPEADILDPATWRQANPSLGFPGFETLEATIRAEAVEAAGDELAEAAFRALRLNGGTSEVSDSRMLATAAEWRAVESDIRPEPRGPLVLGLDLSGGSATSAAAAYWPKTGRVDGFCLVPELPDLARRGKLDGVGDLYERMADRGDLVIAGRRVPDFGVLVGEAVERWGRPDCIVSDPYKLRDLRQSIEDNRLDAVRVIVRSGGYKHGSEDLRFFRRALLRRKLRAPVSLAFRLALSDARMVPDVQGRLKLATRTQGDRRDKARDDLAAALVIAVGVGERWRPQDADGKRRGVRLVIAR